MELFPFFKLEINTSMLCCVICLLILRFLSTETIIPPQHYLCIYSHIRTQKNFCSYFCAPCAIKQHETRGFSLLWKNGIKNHIYFYFPIHNVNLWNKNVCEYTFICVNVIFYGKIEINPIPQFSQGWPSELRSWLLRIIRNKLEKFKENMFCKKHIVI